MPFEAINALILMLAWSVYFFLHSLFSSLTLKEWVARRAASLFRYYRILFNLIALILLLPILAYSHRFSGPQLWLWQGSAALLLDGLALLALIGFILSTRYYDMAEFMGWKQLRANERDVVGGRFTISPFHRYVRHPWYFFALIIVWTRSMDAPFFVTALCVTLYLIVGSRLEDKKLMVCHGERYRRYKALVPGLVPIPWRFLSKRAAHDLSR